MKKLKVYLASRHEDRPEVIAVRKRLLKMDIEVTSRWLLEGGVLKTNIVENEQKGSEHVLQNDLEDIDAADAVVVFSPKKAFGNSTGGRHVEFGYSLAKGKTLILVGYRENVFHWHKDVITVRTHKGMFSALNKLNKAKQRTLKRELNALIRFSRQASNPYGLHV